ncbi:glycosyltransferase [Dokdonella fugitiva]|jgi:glycosyltransferase involved in cell wall biosynthesis|uniref:glycosyltransferase n=1 Tax=Dokdonella fugitiva TaxID=328517 RepID=UPI0015FA8F4A|nr:glycosyltransferase [Dokdonella fugitiva]MBA8883940.1 glycosyltransferase involved in cell wall biosynthesis [Dokdonella fugitiva]
MRILHLGKYYAPQRGGIERHTQALAEACVQAGDAVAVLVHRAPGNWRRAHDVIAGVEVRRAGCIAAPVYTPLSPSFPFELARALREFSPDLLHLHLPNPSCFAVLASPAARRLPWLVHWHADVPPDAPDWRLRLGYRFYRPFERALLARAAAVIATSQPYFEASRALQPWHAKVHVVPLGIDEAGPAAPRPELWPATSGLRLLAVGRLGRYKGFDVLVEALASTPDASLLLVGDGECALELRALARARGVDARIAFAGDVDDATLEAAYAGADAFVLPSLDRGEAFGLVLLEAMRAGLPVVASAIPGSGVGFVVADGESGLLVAPGDRVALAAALARLHDPGLRMRLGDAGRERWLARFTLARSVHAVRELYAAAGSSGALRSSG